MVKHASKNSRKTTKAKPKTKPRAPKKKAKKKKKTSRAPKRTRTTVKRRVRKKSAEKKTLKRRGTNITHIHAREVLDSRGYPTVEATVVLANGKAGSAIVPSGASTGKHEAVELRDEDDHYNGKGVLKAVANVNKSIATALEGMDALGQRAIDEQLIALDGTKNKRVLGANAMLSVSMATARAAAASEKIALYEYLGRYTHVTPRLPIPFANVINGGKHAAGGLKAQEFMIAPIGARTFSEATQMVSETYHALQDILKERYGPVATHVGDEGGFAPPIDKPEEALSLLTTAVKKAGYKEKVAFALDPAASEFYNEREDVYDLGFKQFDPEGLVRYWQDLAQHYPFVSLEDPFDQDDDLSWVMLSADVNEKKLPFQVVGDDLTVTNPARIRKAAAEKLCNVLLLKVNQVGTLTEALEAARIARDAGWNVMVSHRSGETEDTFIADLAVALGCGQIKLGAPCRGERTAKYNRLLRIEGALGVRDARYPKLQLPNT